ncbi:MAG: DegT/DnrJ/EryC1/StrS family aminotransferase [Polyangiales bacterium]
MASPRVPFIDLGRLVRRFREPVEKDWSGVLERCEFVGGPTVKKLEERLGTVLGANHVVSCANGTDALIIGLQVLGVRAGTKVALPNLTFWATYEAIALLGAIPVLVDVDPDDFQLSLEELARAHEKERFTVAILPHLFGWASARLSEIRAFCEERGIALLEDGAQCFGVEVGGQPVLAGARLSTLSFYPAKVVGGAMDGGAIVARDKSEADLARTLCNHGRATHYSYSHVGWNSRMGGLQASFILHVLDELPFILETRRSALDLYRAFAESQKSIRFHGPPKGVTGNGYLSVFTSAKENGEQLVAALGQKGIGAARTYPETMDQQPPASGAIRVGDLARGRAFCRSVVNLPIFAGITAEEVRTSCEAFAEVLG